MNTFKNMLKEYLIPPGLLKLSKRSKSSVELTYPIEDYAKKNLSFKNKHSGERCFILATGPSMKGIDLSKLKNEKCIGVSHFFLHDQIELIKPDFHVFAPYHSPFDFETLDTVFEGLSTKYKHDYQLFIGDVDYKFSIYNYLKNNEKSKKFNHTYINYNNSSDLDEINYNNFANWDISRNPFKIRTVIYSAIQIALYMDFKEIYLLGCDHNYIDSLKINEEINNHHFYNEHEGAGKKEIEHINSLSTERWFYEYYMRWKQYRLMNEFAIENDKKIINLTPNSMLDVFKKGTLDEIL